MKEKAEMQQQHAATRFQEQIETSDAVISRPACRRAPRSERRVASYWVGLRTGSHTKPCVG